MALLSIPITTLDIVVISGITIIGIIIALATNPPNAWVVKLTGKDRKDLRRDQIPSGHKNPEQPYSHSGERNES